MVLHESITQAATGKLGIGGMGFWYGRLERNFATVDADGVRVDDWRLMRMVYAKRITVATSFAPKLSQYVPTQIEIFRIRETSNAPVDAAIDRLVFKGSIYDIRGVRKNTSVDRQFIDLDCELGKE